MISPRSILLHVVAILGMVVNVIAVAATLAAGMTLFTGEESGARLALIAVALWIPGLTTSLILLGRKVDEVHLCFHAILGEALALREKGGVPPISKS